MPTLASWKSVIGTTTQTAHLNHRRPPFCLTDWDGITPNFFDQSQSWWQSGQNVHVDCWKLWRWANFVHFSVQHWWFVPWKWLVWRNFVWLRVVTYGYLCRSVSQHNAATSFCIHSFFDYMFQIQCWAGLGFTVYPLIYCDVAVAGQKLCSLESKPERNSFLMQFQHLICGSYLVDLC